MGDAAMLGRTALTFGRWMGGSALLGLGLGLSGCAGLEPVVWDPPAPAPAPAARVAAAATPREAPLEGPYSLDRLTRLALERHPDLAAALARIEEARGQWIQAGLYPNPMLSYAAEEVGSPGENSAPGFQGFMINQQFVTGGKLQLAQAAAAAGIAAADWQAVTRRYEVVTRVRLAYFEVLAAQREVQATEEIVKIAEQGLEVARTAKKAGTGAEPDILRAEIELSQSRIRLQVAQQRSQAAWKLLAAAVAVPDLPIAKLTGSLEDRAPAYQWDQIAPAVLVRSSEVQAAQALVLQAERKIRQAYAVNTPDVYLQLNPFYAYPERSAEVSLQLGLMIPILNRNQGNILAGHAELAAASAESRGVELRLLERLTAAFQKYQAARSQVETYEKEILPRAAESLRLMQVGYRTGDARFDYTAVLQAQQTLFQAGLAYVQALGDLWKAACEIAGLLQMDELS